MRNPPSAPRPATIGRVVHHASRRRVVAALGVGKREFSLGEPVRSLTQVRNDGTYPHQDVGEVLIQQGDAGIVRESWSFLGESYYTVEFVERTAFVIMRGAEMARAVARGANRSEAYQVRTRGVGILESAC